MYIYNHNIFTFINQAFLAPKQIFVLQKRTVCLKNRPKQAFVKFPKKLLLKLLTSGKVCDILYKLFRGRPCETATWIASRSAFAAEGRKPSIREKGNTAGIDKIALTIISVPFLSPSGIWYRTLTTAYKTGKCWISNYLTFTSKRESNITVKVKNWCNTYTIYVIHKYKAIYAESKLTRKQFQILNQIF